MKFENFADDQKKSQNYISWKLFVYVIVLYSYDNAGISILSQFQLLILWTNIIFVCVITYNGTGFYSSQSISIYQNFVFSL